MIVSKSTAEVLAEGEQLAKAGFGIQYYVDLQKALRKMKRERKVNHQ